MDEYVERMGHETIQFRQVCQYREGWPLVRPILANVDLAFSFWSGPGGQWIPFTVEKSY